MDKHTPGPWKVRFFGKGLDDGENDFFVEAKNNNMPQLGYGIDIMGDDYGEHNGYPREQRLADAKLIASAPDLLAALKNLRGIEAWISDPQTKRLVTNTIQQAIEKAAS